MKYIALCNVHIVNESCCVQTLHFFLFTYHHAIIFGQKRTSLGTKHLMFTVLSFTVIMLMSKET